MRLRNTSLCFLPISLLNTLEVTDYDLEGTHLLHHSTSLHHSSEAHLPSPLLSPVWLLSLQPSFPTAARYLLIEHAKYTAPHFYIASSSLCLLGRIQIPQF